MAPWLGVAVAFAMAVLWSGRPALWSDEAATVWKSQLQLSDLLATLARGDAVHGVYYLLIGRWMDLTGDSPQLLRLPSAIAVAAATAGVVAIALRLSTPRAALGAGLALALLPTVSEYGMEGRSYALSLALATWASYWFIRAVDDHRPFGLAWAVYTALVIVSAYVFVYALLLGLSHIVTLALVRAPRRSWRGLLVSLAVAVVAVLPLLMIVAGQRGQIGWLLPTRLGTVLRLPLVWTGNSILLPAALLAAALWLLVAAGIIVWVQRGGPTRTGRIADIPPLALPWLLGPLTLLVGVSVVIPVFTPRYVLWCAPAMALLVGMAINEVRPRLALAVIIGFAVATAIPIYLADRSPNGRDSWGVKRAVLQSEGRPGDAIMTQPHFYRRVPTVDPVAGMDVVQGVDPYALDLVRFEASLVEELETRDRVWLVRKDQSPPAEEAHYASLLAAAGLTRTSVFDGGNSTVDLYERRPFQR